MPNEEIPLLERVANYYSQLSSAATDLNAVSDELGKSIAEIDFALKKLNLGITTWVTIRGEDGNRHQGDNSFWSRDVGYAKVGGKWGISLRRVDGDYIAPDEETVEEWPFNDAPRSFRLEAIDKIPELLEKLSKDAAKTTKEIRARLAEVQAVSEAVKRAANVPTRIPVSVPVSHSTSRVDLSRVSKPGDVLKAVIAHKKIEQAVANEPSTVFAPGAQNLDSVRRAICSALDDAGHASAAQLLGAGSWTFDGTSFRVEVAGLGKKMLSLTLNAAGEKIVRQELQRIGASAQFVVVPGGKIMEPSAITSNPDPTAVATPEVER